MAEQPKKKTPPKTTNPYKKKVSDESKEGDIFEAPTITREPTSRQCKLGSNVVLRVSASGKPLPGFQWFHNGKKISGANTDRLTLNKVRRSAAGAYHCEAKNFVGKAVSRQCMLSFFTQKVPKLVIEPKEATFEEGKPITLRVVTQNPAEFRDLRVFWVFNGMRIKGALGLELKISAAKKKYEGEYKAMISVGSGLESSNITKIIVVPAKAAADQVSTATQPEPPVFAQEPTPQNLAAESPTPTPTAPPPAWEDMLFNPEDEAEELAESPSLSPLDLIEQRASESIALESTADSNINNQDWDFFSPEESEPLSNSLPPTKERADAPLASPQAAQKAPKSNPKLAKKKAFLEKLLSHWQAQHSRQGKQAA